MRVLCQYQQSTNHRFLNNPFDYFSNFILVEKTKLFVVIGKIELKVKARIRKKKKKQKNKQRKKIN